MASAALLAATSAWTVVLGGGLPARDDIDVILIALSLWVATVAAIAGILVNRSRWARRLGLAVTGGHAVVAVIAPADAVWAAAVALSATAAVAVAAPWLDRHVRGRPAAFGPPARAVILPLVLVAVPLVVGVAGGGGFFGLAAGTTALLAAFWFTRAMPGALVAVRALWPVVGLALAWPVGWPAGAAVAALALAVAGLAWDVSVRAAVVTLERGSVVPIPPELTPPDVLDAADLDDHGRPL